MLTFWKLDSSGTELEKEGMLIFDQTVILKNTFILIVRKTSSTRYLLKGRSSIVCECVHLFENISPPLGIYAPLPQTCRLDEIGSFCPCFRPQMASCQLELHSKCHLQQEHWSDPRHLIGFHSRARDLIGPRGSDYE